MAWQPVKMHMKYGLIRQQLSGALTNEDRLRLLGNNTGNTLFWASIEKILGAEILPYSCMNGDYDLSAFDAFITTDFIWICDHTDTSACSFYQKLLDQTDAPVIPMSIGLQAKNYDCNFEIHPNIVSLLKRLEERCVMGVRGHYTAEILSKYGLRNFQVIGCPSLYYAQNEAFEIGSSKNSGISAQNTVCNFRISPDPSGDFGSWMQPQEKKFLSWCANQHLRFIEQTKLPQSTTPKLGNALAKWYFNHAEIFFGPDEWMNGYRNVDFSIGSRFHGNVAALLNNAKSLFIVCDSRTKEMTDFFYLPTMNIQDFDANKPLDYYYRLADYTQFNTIYPKRYEDFQNYLARNHLTPVTPSFSL